MKPSSRRSTIGFSRSRIACLIQTRVRWLRWFSVLIASLAVPFAWLAAVGLFHSRAVALSVCALIADVLGLMIHIARVGNEGLAVGLALLTKAYFLILVPVLIFRRRFSAPEVAVALSGWRYWRNFRLTGTWTGEIMDVTAAPMGSKLAAITKVNWLKVLDGALWTHIWTGAWSFLTVRSWMYRVFELIFAMVAIMLVWALLRRPWGRCKRKLAMLGSLEALFAAAMAYDAVAIFLAKNISFAAGWYCYSLIVAEALLLTSGVLILAGRRRVLAAMGFLIALFAALDAYSAIFVLARFYRR